MKNKPLNVLMLPKWYPNYMDTAEGNYVYRHIRSVSKLCNVTVLYVHSQKIKNGYEILEEKDDNINVIRVYFNRSTAGIIWFDKLINLFRFIRAQSKGYRIFKKKHQKPDLLHVHSLTRTCGLAFLINLRKKIPFIISEHWSGFLNERNLKIPLIKHWFILKLSKRASAITCVSRKLKEGITASGIKAQVHIIPNVFDNRVFYPGNKPTINRNKNFIHISRLDNHTKNFGGIIRSFSVALKRDTDLMLHVFGDGIEKEKQVKYADQLGINSNIIFYGYQSQEKIAEQLRISAALIVFSNYESQSCAIIESFACGIPVIATMTGGIPEIVNNERGILIEKNNENELTDAILRISQSDKIYDNQRISEFAGEKFSMEIIGKSFENLYRDFI